MKRKSLLILFFIFTILLSTSCNKSEEVLHEMIMVKGEVWKNTGFAMNIQVDEDEIIGEITSTVKSTEIPTENDQANFEIKGYKYSMYGKNIIVSIDNEWTLFLKEEDFISYDKPINNIVNIDYSNLDKDVFEGLSDEEISDLLTDIANEVSEDENYENNLDSIILNVFNDYGVDISSKLDHIKSNLIISRPNQ